MAKVSIIIPVYNVEKYLRESLDSVINQTLKDIEIICVNDCSTDNSLSIIEEYAQQDSRIKIIDLKENNGVAYARNIALDIAQSNYIMFLDPDDWYELNACELAYNQITRNNNDYVMFNMYNYNEFSHITSVDTRKLKYFLPQENNPHITIKDLNMNFMNAAFCTTQIYKKDFLDKNNIRFPNFTTFEDQMFYTRTVLFAKDISIINLPLYTYRKRKSNDSLTSKNLWSDMLKTKAQAFEYAESFEDIDVILPNLIIYIRSIFYWLKKYSKNIPLKEKKLFYYEVKKIVTNVESKYQLSKMSDIDIPMRDYKTILNHNFEFYFLKNFIFRFEKTKDNTHIHIKIFGIKIKLKL